MSKIRLLAIVILTTTAVACKIGSLPPQPKDGATDYIGGIDSRLGLDVGDTTTPHPDSNTSLAPDLGSNAPVDSGTSTGPDSGTGTGTGGAGGTDAFSAVGGAGGTDAPLGTGGAIGTDGGTVVADAPTTPGADALPDVPAGGSGGTDGTTATGGTVATGGTTIVGGTVMGGALGGKGGTANGGAPSGGAPATGGATSTGGTTTTGGAATTGGTAAGGGTTSTGGTSTTGGTTVSGGATSAGGTTTAGGTTASGGTTGAGGTTIAGGTTASGETGGSGGASGSGDAATDVETFDTSQCQPGTVDCGGNGGGSAYFDGFENQTINPFWSFASPNNDGSFSLDNTVAHNGTQSVQLSTHAYGGQANLGHAFPSPVYGTVDVYVYDSAACCTGYKDLWVSENLYPLDQTVNPSIYYVLFWDWGTLETILRHPVDPSNSDKGTVDTVVAPAYTSPGWRRWTITTSLTAVVVQIDGATVFTSSAGCAVTTVALSNCCTAGYANFDDFSFTPTPP